MFGEVRNGVYYTKRKPEHFFRIFHGFGVSNSVLRQLRDAGVKGIIFEYSGKKERANFAISLNDFIREGKGFDCEGDLQTVCDVDLMFKEGVY